MFKKKETEFETEFDYNGGGTVIPSEQYDQMINSVSFEFSGHTNYKFNEDILIEEFQKYVDSTYESHYSKDKFQATEFIIDGGHGMGFCIGNVLKYAQRYGKKGSRADARKDLMKVLHYALISLYVHDTEEE